MPAMKRPFAAKLDNEIIAAEKAGRRAFVNALSDKSTLSDIKKKPDIFHAILSRAEGLNYIHYTRLAAAMDLKDSSTVSRWFAGKSTPDPMRRIFAVMALKTIIENDIKRLNGKTRKAIGGCSMNEHPEIEVSLIDLLVA